VISVDCIGKLLLYIHQNLTIALFYALGELASHKENWIARNIIDHLIFLMIFL